MKKNRKILVVFLQSNIKLIRQNLLQIQNFMTYDRLDMPLTNDLAEFRLETVNGLQCNSKDKIILVYIAYFYNISLNINYSFSLMLLSVQNIILQVFITWTFQMFKTTLQLQAIMKTSIQN
ncbi:transmembrane protein, putative (macronuclear) [Tetrahymena thermophila SB210]|uniref:Transmembrane protein, putative n=1 Tax=Tetrahymena thermophila (strain SB210) TaxID=312017 RepID=W7X6P2_TETTS|nr:transmembrane protein, putative [Tetrahymena thermophila SB210]EWS75050.1 transmembrane protein, putative [Tetrahymena thermophila SB210]|eukprot:XP_012652415.1 transmembrane protein, putative [Tetrahymena thermophila SB210]